MLQLKQLKNLQSLKIVPLLIPLMMLMFKLVKGRLLMRFREARKESIDFDAVLVPVGGGGLIAGVSTYIKETSPEIEVIGVEANGARSMKAAFEAGGPVKLKEIDKFADGIAVQKVGRIDL